MVSMSDRRCALACTVVLFVFLCGMARTAAADPSPTGRTPRIVWTPERQAVWNKMRAEYNVNPTRPQTAGARWYAIAKQNADCACRYSDNGIWGTLLYQITGDHKYVDLAWTRLQKTFFPLTGSNLGVHHAREDSAELVMMYDWLYPGLSDVQRAAFLAKLNEMFTTVTTPNQWLPGNIPFRFDDSDQVTGTYFGVVLHYLATGSYNPTAVEIYNRFFVGGLDSTGDNRDTWRNAIHQFVTGLARGGEWIESSHYNLGTVRLLMIGTEGIRTATGVDHFPEVQAFVRNQARRLVHFTTPDLNQTYQWGDEEFARDFLDRVYAYQTTSGMFAGLTQDDPETGPYIEQLVYDLDAKYGEKAEPWGRFYLFFNPYAARRPRAEMPNAWFADGQGILLQRDGWNTGDSLLAVHSRPAQWYVDHQLYYFGDFQLYRRGEWAVTHPRGYDEGLKKGDAANAMLIAGLSETPEYRAVQAVDGNPESGYAYVTTTMGGQRQEQGSWDPPPTYLHEWTRGVFYLSSPDKHSDTIIVHDRVNAQNPRQLAKFDHYKANDSAPILAAPALKQWFLHTPVQPTMTATGFSWPISSQQQAEVRTLLPADVTRTAVDEATWWPGASMPATERRWHVVLSPGLERQWDTFLNVVQVVDAGSAIKSELVRSIALDVDGALVHRAGQPDALVMFNAVAGPTLPNPTLTATNARSVWMPDVQQLLNRVRLRQKGFQAAWFAASGSTQVYLTDLDPSVAWGVSIDNGIEAPLPIGANGVTPVTVMGPGAHLLRIRAAGETPPTGTIVLVPVCPAS